MSNFSTAQLRAMGALLVLLAIGVFILFLRRGHAAEEGMIITGTSLGPSRTDAALSPSNAGPPPAALSPRASSHAATVSPSGSGTPAESAERPIETLVVHVAGAVRKPGVYRLGPDARADDAVKAAGGAKPNANMDAINLAARLEDGEQLYVPTRQEQPTGGAMGAVSVSASAGRAVSSPRASGSRRASSTAGAAAGSGRGFGSAASDKLTAVGQGTVNINTAGAEELQRLPGVGPAMAARILDFRKQNGPFANVEALKEVPGIGDKKFAKIQPFVRVH